MRIAICEDSREAAEEAAARLEDYRAARPWLAVSWDCFLTPRDLLDRLERGEGFDLFLLDILMGEMDGIQLAEELRRRGRKEPVVFLTSSPDYALSAFSVHAADYLLKPLSAPGLFSALDRAAEELAFRRRREERKFSFRTPGGTCAVPLQSLLYVEVLGHTPYYHLAGRTVQGSNMRVSFREGMAELLDTGLFLQPHRSFLVNVSRISALLSQSITLDDGSSIPVARSREAEIRGRYLDYLEGAYD